MRIRAWCVLTVIAALGAAILVTGCGSGEPLSASPSASGLRVAAFDNPKWGFSLEYPAKYVRIEPSPGANQGSGLLYQVYFADPTGGKSGSSALDTLGITIRSMSRTAKPGDLKKFRSDFENMALQLVGKPEGLKIVQPFRLATLGGKPALKGAFTYKVGGKDVAAVAYLVPQADRIYWVTAQASRQTWATASKELGAALATLKLK